MSGSKASVETQRTIAALTAESSARLNLAPGVIPDVIEDATLFALLYFLANASPQATTAAERLAIAQPLYASISKAGLVTWFVYVAQRTIESVADSVELQQCWNLFSGCEVLERTSDLAQIAFYPLPEMSAKGGPSNPAEVLAVAAGYLSNLPVEWITAPKPPDAQERFHFWKWITTLTCRWVVETKGLEAYRVFDQADWYEGAGGKVHPNVAFRMAREANLALGGWYRHEADRGDQAAYANLVDELSRVPNLRSRAYFLIRHTAPAMHGSAVVVDDRFADALTSLRTHPDLQSAFERFPTSTRRERRQQTG
jgi:hypothetical protein